ncbi:hypothetical protein [Mycobacterium sp. IS-1556]|uniref:hypothetical protein n=1 Tax=Mycobacterium sp. IS-1556 TaxID=1772276 RepID=UPI0007415DF4|nr:hypothetical protein [Mycobacterium sp. IS-1556]KUH89417.1 hypothetical protein AU187_09895 [Mycobacterium sp. IS-1556]
MTQASPNHGEQAGQLLYQLLYIEVLQRVLQNARDGLLVPHWRELVVTMSPLSGPDPMSVHPLVVAAINERPRAAWEPGCSPGWRAAADSWFDEARRALAEHRRLTLVQHAELTKLTELLPVSTRTSMAPSVVDALDQISSLDARNDALARQSLSTFVMQRDKLTASYRAALAAGGEDVDWRSWFEERISTWDNEAGAASARITLQQNAQAYMQRLPEYW